MELRNEIFDRPDVVRQNLFSRKDLHPLPKVLVPLAGNVVRDDEENQSSGDQAFEIYVVRVEIPGMI